MPRIRTVKPEVGTHEELFDLEVASSLPIRFAWVMLWTVCDREGRFRWQPRRLKADVLPYDDLNFELVLDALAGAGFIRKYQKDGQFYGYIPTWHDHQQVNVRESASKLPSPDGCEHMPTPVQAHDKSSGELELERELDLELEGKGKGSVSTRAREDASVTVAPLSPGAFEYSPGQLKAGVGGLVGAWRNVVVVRKEFGPSRDVTGAEGNPRVFDALRRRPDITAWTRIFERVVASDVLAGRAPWRNGEVRATNFFDVLKLADEIEAGAYDNGRKVVPIAPTRAQQKNAITAAAADQVIADLKAEGAIS